MPIRSVVYSFEIVLISVLIGLDKIERRGYLMFLNMIKKVVRFVDKKCVSLLGKVHFSRAYIF